MSNRVERVAAPYPFAQHLDVAVQGHRTIVEQRGESRTAMPNHPDMYNIAFDAAPIARVVVEAGGMLGMFIDRARTLFGRVGPDGRHGDGDRPARQGPAVQGHLHAAHGQESGPGRHHDDRRDAGASESETIN